MLGGRGQMPCNEPLKLRPMGRQEVVVSTTGHRSICSTSRREGPGGVLSPGVWGQLCCLQTLTYCPDKWHPSSDFSLQAQSCGLWGDHCHGSGSKATSALLGLDFLWAQLESRLGVLGYASRSQQGLGVSDMTTHGTGRQSSCATVSQSSWGSARWAEAAVPHSNPSSPRPGPGHPEWARLGWGWGPRA